MKETVELLERENLSCVIRKDGEIHTFRQRGVKDLYEIYTHTPDLLNDSEIADKVVGKGAAAIMVLGKVAMLHATVISQEAYNLLEQAGIKVEYKTIAPYIINRAGDGRCPLETKLKDCKTAEECWSLIEEFINQMSTKKILFICHGNICRSPMAEFVMKDIVKKEGLSHLFEIASAATSTEEIGNPVYPPVRRLLDEHGISCTGKTAHQMTLRDYEHYDMIIAMDRNNLRNINRIIGDDRLHKVTLLMDYTTHPRDVADPWYTRDFMATWYDVNEGCRGLLSHLKASKMQK